MMKKIFGMAAISALAFSMFACSDGEDGMDGVNGKDGADGISCSVKALKDSSGFKVLCDGDSVGVLLNATDGKDGKDGKNGVDGKDGEDGASGDGSKGEDGKNGVDGKNGTSCTAKAVTEGFKIICGKDTVGTLKNGTDGSDGAPGENCTLKDNGEGVVTVTCGETSVNLFRALCRYWSETAAVPYEPETQLCTGIKMIVDGVPVYENVSIPKCADQSIMGIDGDASKTAYDPTNYFCDKGVLAQQCKLHKANDVAADSIVKEFDSKTQYCDIANNKISQKVPCSEGNTEFYTEPGKYCYRRAGTPETKMYYGYLSTCGSGDNEKTYNPVTHFCMSTMGDIGVRNICAEDPATADSFNIDIRYNSEENLDNFSGEICDARDHQIYHYSLAKGFKIMDQYLNYAYLQPTKDLDSSSFCYMNDCSIRPAYGRAYLWSAVIDSTELNKGSSPKVCGYGKPACEFTHPYQGICPTGWHVPSQAEFEAGLTIDAGWNYGAVAYQKDPKASTREERREMVWDAQIHSSSTTQSGYSDRVIWALRDYSDDEAYSFDRFNNRWNGPNPKYYALPVRCVKD